MKQTKYLLIVVLTLTLLFSFGIAQVQASSQQEDTPPPPPADIVDSRVAAGEAHTCFLKSNGKVECYGNNDYGQSPYPVAGTFSQISTGENHACGLHDDGTVECWGNDNAGQSSTTPIGTFLQVVAGGSHSCGIQTDGKLDCWGSDTFNQLNHPAGNFKQISSGTNHSCAVRADSLVICWGLNDKGQTTAPTDTFRSISAGGRHTCGIKTDGTLTCWGSDLSGQSNEPEGTFLQIDAGENHTCGIKSNGNTVCWGSNAYEQSTVPANTYEEISAGSKHTCGLRTDGALICWGDNTYGQVAPPVIKGNAGAPYVTLKYDIDGTPKSIVTDGSGYYTIAVPYHWNGTITPEKLGYVYFVPTDRTYTDLIVNQRDQDYLAYQRLVYRSAGGYDGWVAENAETGNIGYYINSTSDTLYVGDKTDRRQLRSILSFDTSALPDNAVISKATLRVKPNGSLKNDPFTALKNLVVDISRGGFSGNASLQSGDFESFANLVFGAKFIKTPNVNGWYQSSFQTEARANISRTSITQFRLRFSLDDNNDNIENSISLYSGDAATADRPLLILEFYAPMK